MLTIICIMILAYCMMGKEIDSLLEKVKNYNWCGKINELYIKLRPYALKTGRTATRPLLQFYYVMADENTTTLDRVLIYAAIIYTISPVSLIPSAVYRLLGVLDEGAVRLHIQSGVKNRLAGEGEGGAQPGPDHKRLRRKGGAFAAPLGGGKKELPGPRPFSYGPDRK